MVMRYEYHMIRVNHSERRQAISHNCKERHQYVVDDIGDVGLAPTNFNPANQEQHPYQAENRDESCVKRDEEAKG